MHTELTYPIDLKLSPNHFNDLVDGLENTRLELEMNLGLDPARYSYHHYDESLLATLVNKLRVVAPDSSISSNQMFEFDLSVTLTEYVYLLSIPSNTISRYIPHPTKSNRDQLIRAAYLMIEIQCIQNEDLVKAFTALDLQL